MTMKFDKKTHTYTLKGKIFKSVTTWIGELYPFDLKDVSKRVAKFRRMNGELNSKGNPINAYDIRKEWKQTAEFGTMIHEAIEKALKYDAGQTYEVPDIRVKHALDWYTNYARSLTKPREAPELMVWDEELELAGTIDLPVFHGSPVLMVDVIDWKNNLKLASFNRAKKKYTLQLSTYAYMLELKGYKVNKLILVHLDGEKANTVEVPYMKEEVLKLLEERR